MGRRDYHWTGIRWREDVGWELRCESCVMRGGPGGAYWPLTDEFWDHKRSMGRCRACWRTHRLAIERSKRKLMTVEEIAQANDRTREYRRDWARTKRRQLREAEGRKRYERRAKVAA